MTPTWFPSLMSLRKGPGTAANFSEFPGKNLSGGLAPGGPRPRTDIIERTKKVVVVLGGGSFGTAMAARVTNKKNQLEVYMLVRDPLVCQSTNETHCKSFNKLNKFGTSRNTSCLIM
ncbi:hypothetical protein QYF36_016874 [Acer negundo]|nr:hypothetical protein QYF36_016874 [Acer negundo]